MRGALSFALLGLGEHRGCSVGKRGIQWLRLGVPCHDKGPSNPLRGGFVDRGALWLGMASSAVWERDRSLRLMVG